jgi:hypothetical protein
MSASSPGPSGFKLSERDTDLFVLAGHIAVSAGVSTFFMLKAVFGDGSEDAVPFTLDES